MEIKNLIDCIDNCKNCGCYSFECNYCENQEYYRHIDNKKKLKVNLKSLRIKRYKMWIMWNFVNQPKGSELNEN